MKRCGWIVALLFMGVVAALGESRDFYIFTDLNSANTTKITATRKTDMNYSQIWLDDAFSLTYPPGSVATLDTALEKETPNDTTRGIYNLVVDSLDARVPDVDGDGKVIILITQMPSDVYGYFWPMDQYPAGTYTFDGMDYHSNGADMLYVSADSAELGAGASNEYGLETVVTHEFQHLLHNAMDQDERTWVNEGLSEYAMFICGYDHVRTTLALAQIQLYAADSNWPLTYWLQLPQQYGQQYLWWVYLHDRYDPGAPLEWSDQHKVANLMFHSPLGGLDAMESVFANANFPVDPNPQVSDAFVDWGLANLVNCCGGSSDYTVGGLKGYESVANATFSMKPSVTNLVPAGEELSPQNGLSYYFTTHYVQLGREGGGHLDVGFDGADYVGMGYDFGVNFVASNGSGQPYGSVNAMDPLFDLDTWFSTYGSGAYGIDLMDGGHLMMVVSVTSATELGATGYIYWTGPRPLIVTYPNNSTVINKEGEIRWTPAEESLDMSVNPPPLNNDVFYRLEHSDEVSLSTGASGSPGINNYLITESTRGDHSGTDLGPWEERAFWWDQFGTGEVVRNLSSFEVGLKHTLFEETFDEGISDWKDSPYGWKEMTDLLSAVTCPPGVGGYSGCGGSLTSPDMLQPAAVQLLAPTSGLSKVHLSFWAKNEGSPAWAVVYRTDGGSDWNPASWEAPPLYTGTDMTDWTFVDLDLSSLTGGASDNQDDFRFAISAIASAGVPATLHIDNVKIVGEYSGGQTIWGENHYVRAHEVNLTGDPIDALGNVLTDFDHWSYNDIHTVFHYDNCIRVTWSSIEDFESAQEEKPGTVLVSQKDKTDDGYFAAFDPASGGTLFGDYLILQYNPELSLEWVEKSFTAGTDYAEFQIRGTNEWDDVSGQPDWSQGLFGGNWVGPGGNPIDWWYSGGPEVTPTGDERVVNLVGFFPDEVKYIQWKARVRGTVELPVVRVALCGFMDMGCDPEFSQYQPSHMTWVTEDAPVVSCMVMLGCVSETKMWDQGLDVGNMGFKLNHCEELTGSLVDEDYKVSPPKTFLEFDPLNIKPPHPYAGTMMREALPALSEGGYKVTAYSGTIGGPLGDSGAWWSFYLDKTAPWMDFVDEGDIFTGPPQTPEVPCWDTKSSIDGLGPVMAYPCVDKATSLMTTDTDSTQYYAFNSYHTPPYILTGYCQDKKVVSDKDSSCSPTDYVPPEQVGVEYAEICFNKDDGSQFEWNDIADMDASGELENEKYQSKWTYEWSPVAGDQAWYKVYARATDVAGNQTQEAVADPMTGELPYGKIWVIYDTELPEGAVDLVVDLLGISVGCLSPDLDYTSMNITNNYRRAVDLVLDLKITQENVTVPGKVEVLWAAKKRTQMAQPSSPELSDVGNNPEYPLDPSDRWSTIVGTDQGGGVFRYDITQIEALSTELSGVGGIQDASQDGGTYDFWFWLKDEAGNVSTTSNASGRLVDGDRLKTPDADPYLVTLHVDNKDPFLDIVVPECLKPGESGSVIISCSDQGEQYPWGTLRDDLCVNYYSKCDDSSTPDPEVVGSWQKPSPGSFSASCPAAGTLYVWVWVRDKAGNTVMQTKSITVDPDCEPDDPVPPPYIPGWGGSSGNPNSPGNTKLFYWRMD